MCRVPYVYLQMPTVWNWLVMPIIVYVHIHLGRAYFKARGVKNEGKLDRWRSRMLSLVTKTSKERSIELINKVREARFIKIKKRQVNKINRLVAKNGNDRNINSRKGNTQSFNVSNQLHAASNNNIINCNPPVLTTSGLSTYPTLP